jgi:hypothetical protein
MEERPPVWRVAANAWNKQSWTADKGWSSRFCFGPKRDKVTGEWRRLHDDELYDMCSSPNVVHMIKSRRMRWTGHMARTEERGLA